MNIALLLSPEKYHEHLLNNMNIRVDPTLTEYFAEYLKAGESDSDSEEKDQEFDDKSSYSDEGEGASKKSMKEYNEGEDGDELAPSQDDSSSKCKPKILGISQSYFYTFRWLTWWEIKIQR